MRKINTEKLEEILKEIIVDFFVNEQELKDTRTIIIPFDEKVEALRLKYNNCRIQSKRNDRVKITIDFVTANNVTYSIPGTFDAEEIEELLDTVKCKPLKKMLNTFLMNYYD